MNSKRFAYAAALLASALWIGTATLLSVSPGGPSFAESEPVVAEVKGAVLEHPVAAVEAEAQVQPAAPEILGAIEVVQSQLERTTEQLSEQIVETVPPAPKPVSPPPALLQVSVSGGPLEAGVGLDGSGLAEAHLHANLGWLPLP